MNALEVLISVMIMQIATILKGVTPALVTLDTQEMDLCVLVSSLKCSNSITHIKKFDLYDKEHT